MSDPVITFENITPAKAAEYLTYNTNNRIVRQDLVNSWARVMKAGKWQLNGQNIGFNAAGDLVDGQHRLLAVVLSETTVRMGVTRGLPLDSFETIDSGKKRTASDVLGILGIPHRATVSSIARLVMAYKAETTGNLIKAISNTEITYFVTSHQDGLVKAASFAQHHRNIIPAPPSVVGACYYLFQELSPNSCDQFFYAIANAQTDGDGDPRLALIRRLNSMQINREALRQERVFDLFVRTWNAWVNGRPIARLASAPGAKLQWRQILDPKNYGSDKDFSGAIPLIPDDAKTADPKPFSTVAS